MFWGAWSFVWWQFSLLRQLQPPSGVDSALFARLTGSVHANLVVSRGTGLDVYDIVNTPTIVGIAPDGGPSIAPGDGTPTSIELVASVEVPGYIQSMQRVRFKGPAAAAVLGLALPGTDVSSPSVVAPANEAGVTAAVEEGVEVLLLSFAEAKVTLVAWDAFTRQFVTVGMLNFEDGATGVGSSLRGHKKGKNPVGYTATPVVHVDPKSTYVLHVSVWLLAPPRGES